MAEEEIPPIEPSTEPEAADNGNKRGRQIVIAVIVGIAVILGVLFIYLKRSPADSDEEKEKKEETVVSVKVARADKGEIAREFTAVGTVAPAEQSTIAASISAQITEMRLLRNAVVQKGEVLAVLASRDIAAQRAEAKAAVDEARLNLQTLQNVTIPQTSAQLEKELSDAKAAADNARATYERRRDLYAKGGISLKELESSHLALTNAENALHLAERNAKLNTTAANPNSKAIAESKIRQAEDRLKLIETQGSFAEVRAPISGIVTDQFAFQGEFASVGSKLLTISDISSVIVKANFADTVAAALKNGDTVSLTTSAAPDEKLTGSVTLISRSADPLSRSVEVWARFANGRGLLRAGDSVQFTVEEHPEENAVIVPTAAVTLESSTGDEGTVMVVDTLNVAHETKVKVGVRSGDKIQITEGLKGGETVVVVGNYGLPDGARVEIAADEDEKKDKDKD